MTTSNITLLTKSGYKKMIALKSKLGRNIRLAKERRAQLMKEKDFMNEFTHIQEEILLLEAEFREVCAQLENVKILPSRKSTHSTVQIGDEVKLVNHVIGHKLELVSSVEADPLQGKVSVASPIGSQIVGKAVGEVVQVHVPRFGLTEFQIAGIA